MNKFKYLIKSVSCLEKVDNLIKVLNVRSSLYVYVLLVCVCFFSLYLTKSREREKSNEMDTFEMMCEFPGRIIHQLLMMNDRKSLDYHVIITIRFSVLKLVPHELYSP